MTHAYMIFCGLYACVLIPLLIRAYIKSKPIVKSHAWASKRQNITHSKNMRDIVYMLGEETRDKPNGFRTVEEVKNLISHSRESYDYDIDFIEKYYETESMAVAYSFYLASTVTAKIKLYLRMRWGFE